MKIKLSKYSHLYVVIASFESLTRFPCKNNKYSQPIENELVLYISMNYCDIKHKDSNLGIISDADVSIAPVNFSVLQF